jgi:site-specific recombinase XerC
MLKKYAGLKVRKAFGVRGGDTILKRRIQTRLKQLKDLKGEQESLVSPDPPHPLVDSNFSSHLVLHSLGKENQ